MCGGLVGEMFGGVDKLANSINPMKQPMQWLTDNTVSKVFKPAGQLYDYSNSHPLESFIAMMAASAGASALGGEGAAGAGGAEAGAGATGAADAGAGAAADSGSVNLFADAVPGAAGDVGPTAGGMAGTGADTAGIGMGSGGNSGGSFLSSLFPGGSGGGGSGFGANLSTAKNGLGAMQVLSSLYGMEQSRKLQKASTSQAMSKAGMQAVMRSMASQGYQGSGNMMAAMSKYGADAYGANLQQQQAGLANTMSSLGLLTAGMGNLAGWGSTAPAAGNKP